MKNSNNTSVKVQAQNAAVTTVKVIAYPAHLVFQTAADLLNVGQANVIKLIDGTEVYESLMNQESWTQTQQAKVVGKYLELKDKLERQREANRQQDIDRLKAKLDQKEGVEHMPNTEPTPVVASVNTEAPVVTPPNVKSLAPTNEEIEIISKTIEVVEPQAIVVPAPPVAKTTKPRAPRKETAPLMTAPAV